MKCLGDVVSMAIKAYDGGWKANVLVSTFIEIVARFLVRSISAILEFVAQGTDWQALST